MLHYTISCLGMPFEGQTIEERSLGGSESACYYVARELVRRGNKVTVFTASQREGDYDGVRYQWAGEPSAQAPLGWRFHTYAENTPHDVLIAQRHPAAFARRYASKLNLLWLHDLALHRYTDAIAPNMWNVDAVLAVSEWHRQQIKKVYGFHDRVLKVLPNGVDLSLFDAEDPRERLGLPVVEGRLNLLYTSRPERGLEYHVRPGGLMERLAEEVPQAHLYVCGYDNTVPEMVGYYQWLWSRCEELPNVTNLGHLTKKQLADVMGQCDALVYPSKFEETSCVTAMECMAAGLPIIASAVGALPETCNDVGHMTLIPLADGNEPDMDAFVQSVKARTALVTDEHRERERADLSSTSKGRAWDKSVDALESVVEDLFAERRTNHDSVVRHLIRHSDIYALDEYLATRSWEHGPLTDAALNEVRECYGFRNGGWKAHYKAYYEYERRKGVQYGPEDLTGNLRFETVAKEIAKLPPGSTVLDYGCAHGHYTVNLAKRFPDTQFIGVDLEETNIDTAVKWALDDDVSNVNFYCGEYIEGSPNGVLCNIEDNPTYLPVGPFDCIIAAEVLEHVESPAALVDGLAQYLKPAGVFITTTPYGPVEAIGYKKEWPWRAHVHHLERADLQDLFGMHPGLTVKVTPWSATREGEMVGSYVCTFGKPSQPSGKVDYERKFRHTVPRGTLSLCCIVGNAASTVRRMLGSIADVVDEFVIAIDERAMDGTEEIVRSYLKEHWPEKALTMARRPSPLETGFDEARNWTLEQAHGDWALWVDADEFVTYPERLLPFLRHSQFDGYVIPQQHLSMEPPGLLRTDLPVKLFRLDKGIRFFGVVHEHPETALNEGVGFAMVLPVSAVGHDAYETEEVRRGRFARNIEMLVRDREKYPDRVLGKALWLRDLAQMNRYEMERNGGQVSDAMRERAEQGIALYEVLLDNPKLLRYAKDFLEFYSALVEIRGGGFLMAVEVVASRSVPLDVGNMKPVVGRFASLDHARRLTQAMFEEQTAEYESPYF